MEGADLIGEPRRECHRRFLNNTRARVKCHKWRHLRAFPKLLFGEYWNCRHSSVAFGRVNLERLFCAPCGAGWCGEIAEVRDRDHKCVRLSSGETALGGIPADREIR